MYCLQKYARKLGYALHSATLLPLEAPAKAGPCGAEAALARPPMPVEEEVSSVPGSRQQAQQAQQE